MLVVSSSSITPSWFWMAVKGPEKGIWLGSLKGESLGTPIACKAANQPSPKASFQASFMTSSIEFFASANPSLYHLFSQASRAVFKSTTSFAYALFRLAASANFSSTSPSLASSSEDLFSADTWAFLDVTAF